MNPKEFRPRGPFMRVHVKTEGSLVERENRKHRQAGENLRIREKFCSSLKKKETTIGLWICPQGSQRSTPYFSAPQPIKFKNVV